MAARYPLTIDPIVQQAKLTASDGANGDGLGSAVAMTLIAGSGVDWFWETYSKDNTNRKPGDLLN